MYLDDEKRDRPAKVKDGETQGQLYAPGSTALPIG